MIWIRADANKEIGMGHVMRCLSIADALKKRGEQVCFLTADESAAALFRERGQEYRVLHSDYAMLEGELGTLEGMLSENPPSFFLADSYFVTAEYFGRIRKYTPVGYLDDKCLTGFPLDVLINYNIFAEPGLYEGQNPEAVLLLGTKYAPLREEFTAGEYRVREEASRVLVTTGGSDRYNLAGRFLEKALALEGKVLASEERALTSEEEALAAGGKALANGKKALALGEKMQTSEEKALANGEKALALGERMRTAGEKALANEEKTLTLGEKLQTVGEKAMANEEKALALGETRRLEYHVISGVYNVHLEQLRELERRHPNVHIFSNVSDMARRMRESDIAVTAGGSTMYELSAAGVPMICFSFVDNQERIVEGFLKRGLVCFGGNYLTQGEGMLEAAAESLARLSADRELRRSYSEKQREAVDGLGAARIAEALIRAAGRNDGERGKMGDVR